MTTLQSHFHTMLHVLHARRRSYRHGSCAVEAFRWIPWRCPQPMRHSIDTSDIVTTTVAIRNGKGYDTFLRGIARVILGPGRIPATAYVAA